MRSLQPSELLNRDMKIVESKEDERLALMITQILNGWWHHFRLELLFFSWHTPDKTPLALMIMGNRIC